MNELVIPLYDLNYGYVPTLVDSAKVVYATTNFPPHLYPGQIAYLHSADPNFIVPSSALRVKDVVGTRISLEPLNPRDWDGYRHSCYWGYSTRQYGVMPGIDRNWTYGSGYPVVYLYYRC